MVQRKKKNVTIKKEEDPMDFDTQIKWGVDTLMTLVKDPPKKNSLLDNGENIFLQVCLFKLPELDEMVKRRINLKHPPYAGTPEVCFIARDCLRKDRIKRTDDEMIDYTVEIYENFFKKQMITGITSILPYHQLKTEYDTFEMRRKLVNRFDVFLCSASLHLHDFYFKCLGKTFLSKNKFPLPVKLPNFRDEYKPSSNSRVQAAISCSVFQIKEGSDNYCIKIGNTLNEKAAIQENLKVVLDKIINTDLIPGGFKNIRLIGLKSHTSKMIPLYISMDSGRKVPVPYVEPNVAVQESVEGELSTMPGKKVTVLPNGQVFVTSMEDASDNESFEDEGYDEDDSDGAQVENETIQESEDEETYKKADVKKSGKRSREDVSEDEDDDDDDDENAEEAIESAEQSYLANWNENLESSEDEHQEEQGKRKKRNLGKKFAKKFEKKEGPLTKKANKNDITPLKKNKKKVLSTGKEVASEISAKKIKSEIALSPAKEAKDLKRVKKVKREDKSPVPKKKMKKEVVPLAKKLKKGDAIYGKKKASESESKKGEKLMKKKKILEKMNRTENGKSGTMKKPERGKKDYQRN